MKPIKKPKEWFDKNERINKDKTIKLGDKLYHSGLPYQQCNEPWVVVEIIEEDEDYLGCILIKRDAYHSTYSDVEDDPLYNQNFESYYSSTWKRMFRLIDEV